MSKTCEVPRGLSEDEDGKLIYILCGASASYKINTWYVCEKCRATYPKSWPTTLVEGAE